MNLLKLFNWQPTPEQRVNHIRETVDHHDRDDTALSQGWRLFCRNLKCSSYMKLLSFNKNWTHEDRKPVLIDGFAFCEDCAKSISSGSSKHIILDTCDFEFYTDKEINSIYHKLNYAARL